MRLILVCVVLAAACGGKGKDASDPNDVDELPPAEPEPESDDSFIAPEKYDEINLEFKKKRNIVKRCYDKAVDQEKLSVKAKGSVTVGLSITPNGQPTKVHIAKTTLNNKEVENCVVETIQGWELPAPGDVCEFSFTYEFEPE
jgi:TonB family protein